MKQIYQTTPTGDIQGRLMCIDRCSEKVEEHLKSLAYGIMGKDTEAVEYAFKDIRSYLKELNEAVEEAEGMCAELDKKA